MRCNVYNDLPNMRLPIDEKLPDILKSLRENSSNHLILEAAPGAGKTTRVPPALLSEDWCHGQILVSEPRRIAARMAAIRVASERGEKVGQSVGYQVRFDDKVTQQTQLIYMTEGMLLTKLFSEHSLSNVSAVVLDEVHERSADLDVLIALLLRLQKQQARLKLIFMSATLNADELKAFLPAAAHHRSEGRMFPVAAQYLSKEDTRPLPIQVRSAVKSVLKDEGDILVFLPGTGEIRACAEALKILPEIETLPLYGDLAIKDQARALESSSSHKRVILSTNIAESSVTIPRVTSVIDSGLARTNVFDSWSGVSRLQTIKISQARSIQRAGRAGRLQPGRVLHLFTKGEFQARPQHDSPELLRTDLSSILLRLLKKNLSPSELQWLSPPPPSAWAYSQQLLQALGAVQRTPSKQLAISRIGQAMSTLSLPVRHARLMVEASLLGIETRGALAACLLSQRDIVSRSQFFHSDRDRDIVASDCDIEDRIDLFEQLREARFDRKLARDLDIDLRNAQEVDKVMRAVLSQIRQVHRLLPRKPGEIIDEESPEASLHLKAALLRGFPDRVAARRGTSREVVLCGGLSASLHESSAVVHAPLLLALSADAPGGRSSKPKVRLATSISPDWLMSIAGEKIEATENFLWNADKKRVDEVCQLTYGKVILDETRAQASPGEGPASVLVKEALARGPSIYDPEGHLETIFVRLALLYEYFPPTVEESNDSTGSLSESVDLSDETRLATRALLRYALVNTNLDKLKDTDLATELHYDLSPSTRERLREMLPLELKLKGGRRVAIHYEKGRSPWIASRLQDFFSMTSTPTICQGRLPLQLQLLAPNKRAVQVTSDLEGFWIRHYPQLRRELMRRYPRHLWPEDGATARPPAPGKIR